MKRLIAPWSSTHAARVGEYLAIGVLVAGAGCVSQQTYDATRTEADELTRTLEAARIETNELDARIAALQTLNKKEEAAIAEAQAAIQREVDTAPMVRQRADDKLAALQTQVAYLVNQNRLLGRDMADAKQESVSLKALMAQYKREVEDSRPLPSSFALTPSVQPAPSSHSLTQVAPTLPPPTPLPPAAGSQQAQTPSSIPAKPPAVSRAAKTEPAQPDDSWTGMIKTWVSSFWGWIFG